MAVRFVANAMGERLEADRMRTVADHQAAVRELLGQFELGSEPLELAPERISAHPDDYHNRVLAADVRAPINLPPFDNSQMDGYAVRSAELAQAAQDAQVSRLVGPVIAAGDPVGALQAGTAAPIMTGAPIPAGADAVVPIEQSDPPQFFTDGPPGNTVGFAAPVAAGTFVRAAGSDVRAGAVLLAAGTRLGPAALGVLASSGVVEVPVRRRATVLLLSTGHELRQPGETLNSGQIYDANSTMLTAALQGARARVSAIRVPDRPAELLAAVHAAAASVDLVVSTGGVSAGAFEVVREALEPAGVRFGGVAMQPGGPQGLGRAQLPGWAASVPVVAFPGNPVSALVSFELFLRPVLLRLAGLNASRPVQSLPLAHAVDSMPAKHQVRRGIVNDAGMVELVGGSSSHLLHAYAKSSVLVHLPVGLAHADAGENVEIWRIDD
jgi:molybdopterin molybdotransferase